MKHINRLFIVIVWLVVIGLAFSVANNLNNFLKLGWPTLLFYVSLVIVIVYGAVQYSKTWSKVK